MEKKKKPNHLCGQAPKKKSILQQHRNNSCILGMYFLQFLSPGTPFSCPFKLSVPSFSSHCDRVLPLNGWEECCVSNSFQKLPSIHL